MWNIGYKKIIAAWTWKTLRLAKHGRCFMWIESFKCDMSEWTVTMSLWNKGLVWHSLPGFVNESPSWSLTADEEVLLQGFCTTPQQQLNNTHITQYKTYKYVQLEKKLQNKPTIARYFVDNMPNGFTLKFVLPTHLDINASNTRWLHKIYLLNTVANTKWQIIKHVIFHMTARAIY